MRKMRKNVGSSNGSSSSSNSTNGGINTANDSTNGSSDATINSGKTNFSYIHGVGSIVVLSLGVCIFIIPKLMTPQPDKDPKKMFRARKNL